MSRESQQIARLIQTLLRATRGRLSGRWVVLLLVAAVVYAFAQPYLEAKLGIDLPGLTDSAETKSAEQENRSDSEQARAPQSDSEGGLTKRSSKANTSSSSADAVTAELLRSGFLQQAGRQVYETPAGLRYTRGSKHGHRLKHVLSHAEDEPNRPGQHGVFEPGDLETVLRVIDEAYEQALSGSNTKTEQEGNRTVYEVNLRRTIGYIGGQSGNRRGNPAAKHVRMIVQEKNLITAFPVRP